MKKLLVAASFAAIAGYPAAACDWTRAGGASDPVVAATADALVVATTEQTPQAAPASPEARSVAGSESARKPSGEQPPIVLITDRHWRLGRSVVPAELDASQPASAERHAGEQ